MFRYSINNITSNTMCLFCADAYTLKIVGQKKKSPTFNQHRVTYCPHNYWLKFAQLMLGNQFAMWLGKLNCPSVGNPSYFTQLYNCPTVGYIFSWVTNCPTNFTQLDIAQPCTSPTFE